MKTAHLNLLETAMSLIFAVMHSSTEREVDGIFKPDPKHSDKGLDVISLISSTLMSLNEVVLHRRIKLLAYPISGKRFKEVAHRIHFDFPGLRIVRCDAFGDSIAQLDQHNGLLSPEGELVLKDDFISLHDYLDGYSLLLDLDNMATGNKLICTGRRFMSSLNGFKSRSGEVYEIDPLNEKIRIMPFKDGQIVWSS